MNPAGQIITPLSVLSNALKIAYKVTIAMEAVDNKIRVNSQGWEDARIIGERCNSVAAGMQQRRCTGRHA